jgi:NAD-dependent DNA ligase
MMKIFVETGELVSEATSRRSIRDDKTDKVEQAKANPKKFGMNIPIKDFVDFMEYLDDMYHNKGTSSVSDKVFDTLWEVLAERDPSNPYLKKVGSSPMASRAGRTKVSLPYNLPSLAKIRPGSSASASWYSVRPKSGTWLVSDKLDGVSLLLVYSGRTIRAYTRGDSSLGQNVSAIVPRIKNIPTASGSFAVRGELIIDKAVFEKSYSKDTVGSDGFTSARSLVVGTVNRLENSSPLKDINFIAYEVIDPSGKSPEDQLDFLRAKGFSVVGNKVISSISDALLTGILARRKTTSRFEIDGLVVTRNDPYQRTKSDRPTYSIAFKDNTLTEHKTATVTDVIWRTTRTGVLAPRVAVTPVSLGGASVTYFSGFNAFFIEHGYPFKDKDLPENKGKRFPIGPGAKLDVVKSGDVIPFIVRVLKPSSKPRMPDLAFNYDATGLNIVAVTGRRGSAEASKDMAAAMHLHFLKTIGVTDVGVGFAAKLVENRVLTIKDLLDLNKCDFSTKLGLTSVTAAKIYNDLSDCLESVSLATLGDATDAFGRGMGTRKLDLLFADIPNILTVSTETVRDKARLIARISDIAGFSGITAEQIVDGLPKFKAFVQSLGRKLSHTPPRRVVASGPFSKMVVLFSKIRDKTLEQDIISKGGRVASGLRSDVTHLIVKDTSDTSTKIEGARAKNIPILTIDKFKRQYGI